MRVLVACEFSGIVRDAFIAAGHDAVSCDLLPTERPGPHVQGDVLDLLADGWDLMVAHPPCTYFAIAGQRWLTQRPAKPSPGKLYQDERIAAVAEAAAFWDALARAPIPRIALENPQPHPLAREFIGRPSQYVHPWWFGEPESKATGLWLVNLPPLLATGPFEMVRANRVHREAPGVDRWKRRSRTLPGIAAAMAAQWGSATNFYVPRALDLGLSA